MKRIVVFALVLNAALLGVIAHQLVAIAGGGAVATQNGDTNGDGARDISDAVHLLQWLFSGGEPPVAIAQEGGGLSPEQAEMLEHMSIVYLPVDDDGNTAKTIRFSGVNVQVVNGTGSTGIMEGEGENGLGNLIIGYQEPRTAGTNDRSGSHNLVVGTENNYSRWGGQVIGWRNTISGSLSTVSGGFDNIASGITSTVSGGQHNCAEGWTSTVSGGASNTAAGEHSTVSGGVGNSALGDFSTISGGGGLPGFLVGNTASGRNSTVSGGERNTASGEFSTVIGGHENIAEFIGAMVGGGRRTSLLGDPGSEEYDVNFGGLGNDDQ